MCLEFNRSKRVKYGLILCASWMKGDKLFTGLEQAVYILNLQKKISKLEFTISAAATTTATTTTTATRTTAATALTTAAAITVAANTT